MKRKDIIQISLLSCLGLVLLLSFPVLSEEAKTPASTAEAEKEKALKNPYPNDLGPDKINVSSYSADSQEGYKLTLSRCTACHTASRPLNSQFVELKVDKAKGIDEISEMKKSNPEIFKDKLVWQVESGIWQRYVRRMMAKPGCKISDAEGKKIFKFLVEDSKKRKTGSAAASWSAHRKKLVADFKAKYPDQYKKLFETK